MSGEAARFEGVLTEDDFVRLQAELTKRVRFLFLIVPGLVLLLAVFLLARAGFVAAAVGGLAGGLVMLPVAFSLRSRAMRRLYRRSGALGRELRGRVDASGIEMIADSSSVLLPWSEVVQLVEAKDLLVAFDSARSGRPLLRRWFQDDAAWERVRELARRSVAGDERA